jgi:hypothetical protein
MATAYLAGTHLTGYVSGDHQPGKDTELSRTLEGPTTAGLPQVPKEIEASRQKEPAGERAEKAITAR